MGRMQGRFLVVGLVRNASETIREDVLSLRSAFGVVDALDWLLVESDSDDDTVDVLKSMVNEIPSFRFLSLGVLSGEMPLRTDRLAYCRNAYVKEIRTNERYAAVDYVVVADFDKVNTSITNGAFASCWIRDDWDMCAANQSAPYFDVWALRHREWSPNDCWAQYDFLNRFSSDSEQNRYSCIYSRMIRIPANHEWIEVDSAFGGLAIYRAWLFQYGEYVGLTEEGNEVCEHVAFHYTLKARGARLFINPAFINAGYIQHTKHLSVMGVLLRVPKRIVKRILARFN